MVHKTVRITQQPFVTKLLNFSNCDFLKKKWVELRKNLWAGRSQNSNSGNGECFLSPQKPPKRLGVNTDPCLECTILLQRR